MILSENNISVWLILLGLTIFSFGVAEINARIDAFIIAKKQGITISLNHTTRTIIRLIIFIISSFFTSDSILGFLFLFIVQWFSFSLYFDLRLNKLRGLNYWYIGKTSNIDKLVRESLGGNSGIIYAMLKMLIVAFSSIGKLLFD